MVCCFLFNCLIDVCGDNTTPPPTHSQWNLSVACVFFRSKNGGRHKSQLLLHAKQECTLISKERRHALRVTQGPRSRASIAACHSSFQTPHSSLGATYNFLCDSVPDLTCASNGGVGGIGIGGGFTDSNSLSVLHNSLLSSSPATAASSSAPRKISLMRNGGGFSSYHSSNNFAGNTGTNGSAATINTNTSNTTCSSITNNNNHTNNNNTNNNNNNDFLMNGYNHSTPLRMQNHQQQKKSAAVAVIGTGNTTNNSTSSPSANNTNTTIDYDNDDNVVQLRRRNASLLNKMISYENSANDKLNDWMYRRPTAPNDIRHSCKY